MYKYTLFFILLFGLSACVEPYEFEVINNTEGIVIEAFISNKSFNETLTYPSDGRHFRVKLSKTSDVINIRTEKISGANVILIDDLGNVSNYYEDNTSPGEYILYDLDFKAQLDRKYQIKVEVPSGEKFESDWEFMPVKETQLNNIFYTETTLDQYIYKDQGEKEIESIEGIDVNISIPKNNSSNPKYYKWTYEPIWVYTAPEADDAGPIKKCWIRNPYYLKYYTLQKDNIGDYGKKLFFIQTTGNDRIYEYFSVLITQAEMSEGYYYFWKDLESQNQKGGLYDQPPFNLSTNFKATNNDWSVNGYFGVVAEEATRWEFDKDTLSYYVINDIAELCKINYGPPVGPTDCDSCMEYTKGVAINTAPWWW